MENIDNKYNDEEIVSDENKDEDLIPTQYKGLPSNVLEELWIIPVYSDNEKTKAETQKKEKVIKWLREKEKAESKESVHSLSEKDIAEIKNEAYARYKSDPDINTDIMLANIDWKIGQRFDAHGIAKGGITTQFDDLIRILKEGIDPDRPFHTAPLEVDPKKKAALGAGLGTGGGAAYKDGSFILLSGPDSQIKKDGLKYVIVNEAYYHAINKLAQAFPEIGFIKGTEINEKLKEILDKN